MVEFKLLAAGDTALVVEFGDQIDRNVSNQVIALSKALDAQRLPGLVETVPTFRSLMIHYEPSALPYETLATAIHAAAQSLIVQSMTGRHWRIPVCYDPSFAPDLDHVADRTGLSQHEVVALHGANTYHVYMLGFLPGQAYMGDVPPMLQLPRRETPRQTIPAGSIAIAMAMTCIFPQETPCGWHLIGRSPIPLWREGPPCGALLSPGDRVDFTPISLSDYAEIADRVSAGWFDFHPVDDGPPIAPEQGIAAINAAAIEAERASAVAS